MPVITSDPTPPKKKEGRVIVREDQEVIDKAKAKAKRRGTTLSAVLRAFLKLWAVDNEEGLDPDDIEAASRPAPQPKTKKKRNKN
ncbi:MAG: hypothetical protein HC853_11285 [Anaerolineae bacterium]|nr:hypothetical protein [Anaerolineae bacterium]